MLDEMFTVQENVKEMLDAMPFFVYIVNDDVVIKYANRDAEKMLADDDSTIVLKYGGEALKCIHFYEQPEGCGNTAYCKSCIVRNSVEKAFSGKKVHKEKARMQVIKKGKEEDAHFLVTASPFA